MHADSCLRRWRAHGLPITVGAHRHDAARAREAARRRLLRALATFYGVPGTAPGKWALYRA